MVEAPQSRPNRPGPVSQQVKATKLEMDSVGRGRRGALSCRAQSVVGSSQGAQDGLLGGAQEELSLPAGVQTARGDPQPSQSRR